MNVHFIPPACCILSRRLVPNKCISEAGHRPQTFQEAKSWCWRRRQLRCCWWHLQATTQPANASKRSNVNVPAGSFFILNMGPSPTSALRAAREWGHPLIARQEAGGDEPFRVLCGLPSRVSLSCCVHKGVFGCPSRSGWNNDTFILLTRSPAARMLLIWFIQWLNKARSLWNFPACSL